MSDYLNLAEPLLLLQQVRQELTPRECDVFQYLLCSPASSWEISRELGISHSTLREYSTRVYRKVGVSCRVELIFIFALQMPLARVVEVLVAC